MSEIVDSLPTVFRENTHDRVPAGTHPLYSRLPILDIDISTIRAIIAADSLYHNMQHRSHVDGVDLFISSSKAVLICEIQRIAIESKVKINPYDHQAARDDDALDSEGSSLLSFSLSILSKALPISASMHGLTVKLSNNIPLYDLGSSQYALNDSDAGYALLLSPFAVVVDLVPTHTESEVRPFIYDTHFTGIVRFVGDIILRLGNNDMGQLVSILTDTLKHRHALTRSVTPKEQNRHDFSTHVKWNLSLSAEVLLPPIKLVAYLQRNATTDVLPFFYIGIHDVHCSFFSDPDEVKLSVSLPVMYVMSSEKWAPIDAITRSTSRTPLELLLMQYEPDSPGRLFITMSYQYDALKNDSELAIEVGGDLILSFNATVLSNAVQWLEPVLHALAVQAIGVSDIPNSAVDHQNSNMTVKTSTYAVKIIVTTGDDEVASAVAMYMDSLEVESRIIIGPNDSHTQISHVRFAGFGVDVVFDAEILPLLHPSLFDLSVLQESAGGTHETTAPHSDVKLLAEKLQFEMGPRHLHGLTDLSQKMLKLLNQVLHKLPKFQTNPNQPLQQVDEMLSALNSMIIQQP